MASTESEENEAVGTASEEIDDGSIVTKTESTDEADESPPRPQSSKPVKYKKEKMSVGSKKEQKLARKFTSKQKKACVHQIMKSPRESRRRAAREVVKHEDIYGVNIVGLQTANERFKGMRSSAQITLRYPGQDKQIPRKDDKKKSKRKSKCTLL